MITIFRPVANIQNNIGILEDYFAGRSFGL
jgi:hypothetical protein